MRLEAVDAGHEADGVGPAYHIVGRRIGEERRSRYARRSLVGQVVDTRRDLDVVDRVPVRVQVEVAVRRYTRIAATRSIHEVLHGGDEPPVQRPRERSHRVTECRVGFPLRVTQVGNARSVRGDGGGGIAYRAGEVQARDGGHS